MGWGEGGGRCSTVEVHPLVYPDGLVLVPLCGNHDVGFIQHKQDNLAGVQCSPLQDPVKHCPRCAHHNLLADLLSSLDCSGTGHRTAESGGQGSDLHSRLFPLTA